MQQSYRFGMCPLSSLFEYTRSTNQFVDEQVESVLSSLTLRCALLERGWRQVKVSVVTLEHAGMLLPGDEHILSVQECSQVFHCFVFPHRHISLYLFLIISENSHVATTEVLLDPDIQVCLVMHQCVRGADRVLCLFITVHPDRKYSLIVYQFWYSGFGVWGLGFGVWGLGFG